jgi:hypothetical protein
MDRYAKMEKTLCAELPELTGFPVAQHLASTAAATARYCLEIAVDL